ncbi:MAG: hypothetical protein PHQ60_08315 [Sideroxydans sp.]|nr:hypothetical protein [Sideroxydans sp.]
MNENQNIPRYQTNWGVRFLCDCNQHEQGISIQKGIAHEISTRSIRMLSDHNICPEKRVAMQLIIPPTLNSTPQKVIKIIGNSRVTNVLNGKFITEIELAHFENDGRQELERTLRQHFDPQPFMQTAQRA